MKITIHQPEHIPWPGFFHKMANVDLYVVLDNVQFTKNNYQNRNRLIERDGTVFWSSVPVLMAGHTGKTIADMKIDSEKLWARKVWGRVANAYCRHPYYERMEGLFAPLFHSHFERLIDLNMALISAFRDELGITTPMVRASEMAVSGKKSELLADITAHAGGKIYLSGPSGQNYLDREAFAARQIDLEFQDFAPPVYPATKYQPYLSTLDLLMNVGPKARGYIGLDA